MRKTLFTTKLTLRLHSGRAPDTKGSDNLNSALRPKAFGRQAELRVLRGEKEFSPLPATPDGETCRRWVDLSEPLWHNKTVFTLRRLGRDEINGLKYRANALNLRLNTSNSEANAANRTAAAPP